MAEVGDVLLGKYRILRRIGLGGMGSVWEAVHEQIGKRVAVKILHPDMSLKPDLVARFTREARAAGAIGHSSIIDVYDIGTSDEGAPCLVMECLKGQNLAQVLKRVRGPIPDMGLSLYVVCQTLSALEAAHDKGIIHRDLKPDNIFLVQSGQFLPDIKLLDFGISKMIVPGTPDDRLTQTGTIMGTPFYMAPEQARGRKEVDHRVDIYAMGVILYECLTGQVPFWAENTFALVYEILNSPLSPPRALRPEIPEPIEQAVLRALSRDPAERYQRAFQMLEGLFPLLADQAKGRISLPQQMMDTSEVAGTIDSVPGLSLGISALGSSPPASGASSNVASSRPGLVSSPPGSVPATRLSSSATSPEPGTPMGWTVSGEIALATRPKLKLIIGAVVAAVVVLIGGVVVAAAVLLDGDDDEPEAARSAVVAQASEPVEAQPAAASVEATTPPPTAAASPRSEPVAITLEGVPEAARVFIDDELVEGLELRQPRSSEEHTLRIEAAGHQAFTDVITFDQERTIEVALEPIEAPRQRPRRRRPAKQRRSHRGVPNFDTSFN